MLSHLLCFCVSVAACLGSQLTSLSFGTWFDDAASDGWNTNIMELREGTYYRGPFGSGSDLSRTFIVPTPPTYLSIINVFVEFSFAYACDIEDNDRTEISLSLNDVNQALLTLRRTSAGLSVTSQADMDPSWTLNGTCTFEQNNVALYRGDFSLSFDYSYVDDVDGVILPDSDNTLLLNLDGILSYDTTNEYWSVANISITISETFHPSPEPTSLRPSLNPSMQPTLNPSTQPWFDPTAVPSSVPTFDPTEVPSSLPTNLPSGQPSMQPSAPPSVVPTVMPSGQPSSVPTFMPTGEPSSTPTFAPTPFDPGACETILEGPDGLESDLEWLAIRTQTRTLQQDISVVQNDTYAHGWYELRSPSLGLQWDQEDTKRLEGLNYDTLRVWFRLYATDLYRGNDTDKDEETAHFEAVLEVQDDEDDWKQPVAQRVDCLFFDPTKRSFWSMVSANEDLNEICFIDVSMEVELTDGNYEYNLTLKVKPSEEDQTLSWGFGEFCFNYTYEGRGEGEFTSTQGPDTTAALQVSSTESGAASMLFVWICVWTGFCLCFSCFFVLCLDLFWLFLAILVACGGKGAGSGACLCPASFWTGCNVSFCATLK